MSSYSKGTCEFVHELPLCTSPSCLNVSSLSLFLSLSHSHCKSSKESTQLKSLFPGNWALMAQGGMKGMGTMCVRWGGGQLDFFASVCACVHTREGEGGTKSRRRTDGNEDREGAGMINKNTTSRPHCQFEIRTEGISAFSLARCCTAAPPLPLPLSRTYSSNSSNHQLFDHKVPVVNLSHEASFIPACIL